MKVLAIMGSHRRKAATDKLVDKAIEGFLSASAQGEAEKITLIDHKIGLCRNCFKCHDAKIEGDRAECVIKDDMTVIAEKVEVADAFIFGCPLHMGYATGAMMVFLERICWTFAKPEGKILGIEGVPVPRTKRRRNAVSIVCAGTIPPLYRRLCDHATPLIKDVCKSSLNTRLVDNMFAGALEKRGAEHYFDRAFKLGQKLAK